MLKSIAKMLALNAVRFSKFVPVLVNDVIEIKLCYRIEFDSAP